MKKTIFLFITILIAVFILFSLLDYKGDYSSEKQIWKINREFVKVSRDPKAVPDATFNKLAKRYEKFIKRFPDAKVTPIAHLHLGYIQIAKNDFDGARERFEDVIRIYNNKPNIAVQAAADIARAYALERDEAGVLSTYQRVIRDYPLTDLGLNTPLLMSKFYADRGKPEKAKETLESAITSYNHYAKQYPDSRIGFNSLRLLASCYLAQSEWGKAVGTFAEILYEYSAPEFMDIQQAEMIIQSINTISVSKLKNYNVAINIYKEFIRRNPNHSFVRTFEQLIKSFSLLKEKNIKIGVKER